MPRPELALPAGVEVLIIGAGAVGCSLAYHLASKGQKNVLVVDRGGVGEGSTGRCAGGVRQQFSTEVNVRLGIMSVAKLRAFEEELGVSADFRQIGYLLVASEETGMGDLRASLALQRRVGLDDVREVNPAEIAELVPGLEIGDLVGGTFCPSDGIAGPSEVTQAYAHVARSLGVRIM